MKLIENLRRKKDLLQFGFGTDVMKKTTVCTNCKSMESAGKQFCSKCGRKLPKENLYDYYKAQHESCIHCHAILSEVMDYCPKCGMAVKKAE